MQLTFGAPALPLAHEVLGVPPGRLELDPAARTAWWLASLRPLRRDTTLVYAMQLAAEHRGMVFAAFADEPLKGAEDKLVSLCLVHEEKPSVMLADMAFMRVVAFHIRN
jgi:hypothetical protein